MKLMAFVTVDGAVLHSRGNEVLRGKSHEKFERLARHGDDRAAQKSLRLEMKYCLKGLVVDRS